MCRARCIVSNSLIPPRNCSLTFSSILNADPSRESNFRHRCSQPRASHEGKRGLTSYTTRAPTPNTHTAPDDAAPSPTPKRAPHDELSPRDGATNPTNVPAQPNNADRESVRSGRQLQLTLVRLQRPQSEHTSEGQRRNAPANDRGRRAAVQVGALAANLTGSEIVELLFFFA